MHGIRLFPSIPCGGLPRLALLLGGWLTLASALAAALAAEPLQAQGSSARGQVVYPEYDIKAAFLLNFTKYVYWPRETFRHESSPIVVGLLGRDPFGTVIDDTFAKQSIHGRELVARRLTSTQEAASCCHLIFISRDARNLLPPLLTELHGAPVLIVGESERFLRDGGGINLLVEKERVVFEINLDATKAAGLRLQSDFVRLARRVLHEKRWERQRR